MLTHNGNQALLTTFLSTGQEMSPKIDQYMETKNFSQQFLTLLITPKSTIYETKAGIILNNLYDTTHMI